MGLLWQRLTQSYGESWNREFGDIGGVKFQYWTAQLYGLSAQSIGRGIQQCIDSDDNFVPNLPTFKKRCNQPAEQQIVDNLPKHPGLSGPAGVVRHLTHDQDGNARTLSPTAEAEVEKMKELFG